MFSSPSVGYVWAPEIEINSTFSTFPIVLNTGPGEVITYGTGMNIAAPSKINSDQVRVGLNFGRIPMPFRVGKPNVSRLTAYVNIFGVRRGLDPK
jgi:hypothetical protein